LSCRDAPPGRRYAPHARGGRLQNILISLVRYSDKCCAFNVRINTVYLPWTGFYIYKLFEVAPYISDVNFGAIVGYGTFINLDLWNSWPPDFQELCRQIGLEAERLSDKIVGEFDRQALDMMLSAGAVLVHFQEQEQLEKAVPDPIELVEQSVAAFAKPYEAPARKYGDFLRTRLAQGHE